MDDLNRHAALEFLTDRWLDEFQLRDEDAQFGQGTHAEFQTLPEAITRELARPGVEELRLFLAGNPSEWDIAASPLRGWVQKWASVASAVKLVLPPDAASNLSQADRFVLSILSSLDRVSVWSGDAPPCQAGGQSIAEIIAAGRTPLAWAYRTTEPAYPTAQWAAGTEFLVRGQPNTTGKLLQQVSMVANALADMKGKVHRFEITSEQIGRAHV